MFAYIPDHFSSKFKFVFKKVPAKASDRSSFLMVVCGWISGLLLLALGIYELHMFVFGLLIRLAESHNFDWRLILQVLPSFAITIIGVGLILGPTLSFMRYKKICFDGKDFHVIYKPTFGKPYQFSEPLKNYTGVRLRVLFAQEGLFNKCRYIIDLYHMDSNKIIPLYISTRNKDIRKIWEAYATMFKMPTISVGDRGMVQKDWKDLNKSVKELEIAKKLPFISSGKMPAPNSIDIKETKSATIITTNSINWDIFSVFQIIIYFGLIFAIIWGGLYFSNKGLDISYKIWGIAGVLIFFLFYLCTRLLYLNSIHIYNDRISITKTLFNNPISEKIIYNDAIKGIELTYDPTVARYDVIIIDDNDITNLKNRLPVADLLWLKDFILRKLINN